MKNVHGGRMVMKKNYLAAFFILFIVVVTLACYQYMKFYYKGQCSETIEFQYY